MSVHHAVGGSKTIAALSHPTRVRVLAYLRMHQVASPTEIAAELRIPLGNVSYHARRLEALGLIRLVERRQRRGAIEHRYTLAKAADDDLVRHMTGLLAGSPESRQMSARVVLDPIAVGELRGELRALFTRMQALEGESEARAGAAPAYVVDVSCVMELDDGA